MRKRSMSAIRDINATHAVSIFFGSQEVSCSSAAPALESSSMNRKFASLYIAAGLLFGAAGTALAQVPNPPTDLSVEGGSTVPSQPTGSLFYDNFEYSASR